MPDNLHLSGKVNRQNFKNYMDKAVLKRKNNYKVLSGYICASTGMALMAEMLNR